jgi:enoyl-CoA hydratase/carnithine racemase
MTALMRRFVAEGVLELRLNRPERLSALAADVRVASRTAQFGDVVIKTDLSGCDVGISCLLPRIAGAGVASELMLTGRAFDADEARELRIVSRVTEPEARDGNRGPDTGARHADRVLRRGCAVLSGATQAALETVVIVQWPQGRPRSDT